MNEVEDLKRIFSHCLEVKLIDITQSQFMGVFCTLKCKSTLPTP